MEPLRLVTIHPALVHYALGTLPLILLAYGLGYARRSERWTFVGDVAIGLTAPLAVLAAVFGLVSFRTLRWPGGVGPWPWLHLGGGLAFAFGVIALAAARLARRDARPIAGAGTLAAAIAIGAVSLAVGWVGGELLVFRAGMGVEAAAGGALAPSLPRLRSARPPERLIDAMRAIRPAWGGVETDVAAMIVGKPGGEELRRIATAAETIAQSADWIAREGPKTLAPPDEPTRPAPDDAPAAIGGGPPVAEPDAASARAALITWSEELGERARALRAAAGERDVEATIKAAGQLRSTCAGCHGELRWRVGHERR